MNHSFIILGKYAILQHDISAQLAERRKTRDDKQDFFARFARPNSLTHREHRDADEHRTRPEISPMWERVNDGDISGRAHTIETPATETDKLVSLTEGSQDNLFVAKTIFPFMLFADTLKIDRQKITIVHNDLWRSETASTEIRNIINVQANVGPLFGSITVTSKHFLNNTQTIRHLRTKDITTAQRLLQGFMIAHRAQIDTDTIEKKRLLLLLNDLGQENRR